MKHEYFLMLNIQGKSFAKYKGDAIRISEQVPITYDEVFVGVKKHPNKMRRITTFRDKDGNIIERSFDYSDGKLRNRVYTKRTVDINEQEKVESTTIHDYFIKKHILPYRETLLEDFEDKHPLKNLLWNLTKIVTNHFSKNKVTGEKVLSQVRIDDIQSPTKQKCSFIEFPHIIKDKIQKANQKFLKFTVNGLKKKLVPKTVETQGVKFPKKDSYIAYRALTVDDAKSAFAQRYLEERNLKNLLIEIEPHYYPLDEDEKLFAAHFDPENGSINFNRFFKPKSKTIVAGSAKHEAEHAWQYFLRSRIAPPTTEWEEFVSETFGKIKSKALQKEAMKYAKSIQKYVPLSRELRESGEIQKYRDNYIEKRAINAATKEKKKYDREGKSIRKSFCHIPEEYL